MAIILAFLYLQASSVFAAKKSYIVYMGSHSHGPNPTNDDMDRAERSHHEFLASYLGSHENTHDAIFYSYTKYINGFAANLEEEQAAEIAKHSRVVSVFLDTFKKLHTTHSWDFMNLEKNDKVLPHSLWSQARFGEDTIIANLDTGVWPESASFNDAGYGPIPKRFKGICENGGTDFKCNKKLIGGRVYSKGYLNNGGNISYITHSPRDKEGHGSHTLSTAGGNIVPDISVLGTLNGTAAGGSPRARVVAYKVCWSDHCTDSDILQGFEQAIHDGVDVISISLGSPAVNYFEDVIAIAAFHAFKKGISVVCSAGNDGPKARTVTNIAPWILTVGASTIDREFQTFVMLGNGRRFKGTSISVALKNYTFYPIISGVKAKLANASDTKAMLCEAGTLDPSKVKGKILACLRGETARVDKGMQAYLAGAAGVILCNDKASGNEIISDAYILPAAHVNYEDGRQVMAYASGNGKPIAYLTPLKAVLNTKPAPAMAAFSSRGPNPINPDILKPDVTAPGVNIIAAFTEAIGPTSEPGDNRRTGYLALSGTSMSCPHVTGVVGLLKTLYPHWSPAAIRSAIMTTARRRDNTLSTITDQSTNAAADPFAYGAGHIRPNLAMDPGFVYDITPLDYIRFLCAIGYNETSLMPFLEKGHHYKCHSSDSVNNLNYPSFSVPHLRHGETVTLKRYATNVGTPTSVYKASVTNPKGASISVEPKILKFKHAGERKSFKVIIRGVAGSSGQSFGELSWSDGKHYVRSPVAVNVY